MTTRLEFMPPRSLPDRDFTAALRSALDGQKDIVAAYFVTVQYFDPKALQEELHFELADLPGEGGAPQSLFRRVASEVLAAPTMPFGRHPIFTFPTAEILPAVRVAGVLLWGRGAS